MLKLLFIILVFCYLPELNAKNFKVKSQNFKEFTIPSKLRFLTSGKEYRKNQKSYYLRVSIIVQEIYRDIFIEEIERGDGEGLPNNVINSHYLSGFDIAEQLGYRRGGFLEGLTFERWLNPTQFEMSDSLTHLILTYDNHKNKYFNIRAVEKAP